MIAAEHFGNFFMNNMPAYCMGLAEFYEGPIEDPEWLKIAKTRIPGAPDLGQRLVREVMKTVDTAFAEEWKFDHGIMVPLNFLTPEYDLPVIPVNINCQGPPLTPLHRAWAFGEALRRACDSVPEKIAIVGTGGNPVGNLYPTNAAESPAEDPLILVAGGTGVAPFVGVLEHWFSKQPRRKRQIYLYLGVRAARDLLLDETLSRWDAADEGFRYVPALSRPGRNDAWEGETGYINTVLDRHFRAPLSADVSIAGSPIMIRETIKVLRAKGLDEKRIRHDPPAPAR